MKKIIRLVSLLTLLALIVCCFVACTPDKEPTPKNMTLVVTTDPYTVYTVDLNKLEEGCTVLDVFAYLAANEGFTYTAEDGQYGAFLTKVLTLEQSEDYNPYISLYTSIESDGTAEYGTVVYEGTTLYAASVGVSTMTVAEGCTIYVTLISY